jgi:alpha-maltose-1-phosphate synthase
MKVALSTIGRFHTFDLAREMHLRGALAEIFSGYPWFKLKGEGLPRERVRTFPYLHAPYMKCFLNNHSLRKSWEWHDRLYFDRYVSWHLPDCDVFCGLSGSGLFTSQKARSRGVKCVCDRGSSHIRLQDALMQEEYGLQGLPYSCIDSRIIEREEEEYELADVITVPSTFVFKSFVESGVPESKLRLVPYGVNLSKFYPCETPPKNQFRVLFVGGVSIRKGIPYLLQAFRKLQHPDKHLTLAGGISPEVTHIVNPLRNDSQITVKGHVPQDELKRLMSSSHAMVLASIEEGLACVQAQALACGCPVIATKNTGAEDLFADGREGFIVPIRDADAIADRLQMLADHPSLRSAMSEAALRRVKSIGGWDKYGTEMYEVFRALCQ